MATAVPVAEPQAKKQIGNYHLDAELGRGAFGVVYRAHHDSRPDVPLALKLIKGTGNTDRLLLEPAVLSRLEHPCIVRLEDYFLQGDDLVLALEFIDGKDLKSLIDSGVPFTQADVRDLLVQVGSALVEAHAKNVVHRDIKPANILVQQQPEGGRRYVLTDFGIGQVREGIQSEKRTGGTYLFMAPEQLRGRPGPQSDLWALGVVAYWMLTRQLPFPGPTIGELTRQILYGTATIPSALCQEPIDPDLEKAILHLLDRSPQERTPSARELLRELRHRGPPDSVLKSAPKVTGKRDARHLDRKLMAGIRNRWILIILCLAFYLLPAGFLSGLLHLGGMVVFFFAQRGGRLGRFTAIAGTVLAFALLGGYSTLRYYATGYDVNLGSGLVLIGPGGILEDVLNSLPEILLTLLQFILPVLIVVGYIVYLFLPVIAGSLLASMRRLQREKLLRDLACHGDAASDKYLEQLRLAVDTRFEDVGLHLKYAEALYARGAIKEAAVEARILLRQDPYHFNANLLLANAYHGLGLDEECIELCDRYLAVSGYCFEFNELRELCQRRLAP